MTDQDDGEREDNPQLRALRAVWLSLPDEDPPERGLAELMTAARAKAELMSSPSWWQRTVALLRRPPVLALASVMVLLGGAVMIGRRGDKLQSAPASHELRQDEAPSNGVSVPVGAGSAPAAPMPAPEPAPEPALEATPADKVAAPVVTTPAQERPARKSAPPPVKREESKHAVESGTNPYANEPTVEGKHGSATKNTGVKTATTGASQGGRTKLDADQPKLAEPEAGEDLREVPAADVTAAPGGAAEAPSKDAEKKPAQAPVAQSFAQARSAASRGDCGAARVIAGRIAKQDAQYYRNVVLRDATLKKCIAAGNE